MNIANIVKEEVAKEGTAGHQVYTCMSRGKDRTFLEQEFIPLVEALHAAYTNPSGINGHHSTLVKHCCLKTKPNASLEDPNPYSNELSFHAKEIYFCFNAED